MGIKSTALDLIPTSAASKSSSSASSAQTTLREFYTLPGSSATDDAASTANSARRTFMGVPILYIGLALAAAWVVL